MATENYFWQSELADGSIQLGLNEAGRELLGEIRYVDLPQVNQTVKAGEMLIEVEAEKMVQDLPTPITGEVVTVHQALKDQPELLSSPDSQKNWVVTLKK
ncbi:glycine cleavage system protein H [Lapidilactobacillus gannanensis]|jgi:glycine cleavage system H protein|uniref:Glycine cleavage system protein H n=1 Tax=Lapidilactobacillus gannanensis TaxID=2486002 RepID=A0ABW4BLK6_9LACO|nr:glycine cleavage system protein H [Lapidilactobacillus gannanensis]MCH4057769.1 glycine cleavage system protein H [Lactobacillaceae bacterium]